MWDGGAWTPLGSGVTSGGVTAIATWDGVVYVGGDFTRAGDVRCSRMARFNGTQWFAMGDMNGDVYSVIIGNGKVYIGGDFTVVDGKSMSHVAVYRSGQWEALGRGVNGQVYALGFVGECVYMGGMFTKLGDGKTPALYAARICEGRAGSSDLQDVEGLDSFSGIGPIRAITPALG